MFGEKEHRINIPNEAVQRLVLPVRNSVGERQNVEASGLEIAHVTLPVCSLTLAGSRKTSIAYFRLTRDLWADSLTVMSTYTQTFLEDIEAFLVKTGLPANRLGRQAVGTPNLIYRLREGKSCSIRTMDRVIEFMRDYEAAP